MDLFVSFDPLTVFYVHLKQCSIAHGIQEILAHLRISAANCNYRSQGKCDEEYQAAEPREPCSARQTDVIKEGPGAHGELETASSLIESRFSNPPRIEPTETWAFAAGPPSPMPMPSKIENSTTLRECKQQPGTGIFHSSSVSSGTVETLIDQPQISLSQRSQIEEDPVSANRELDLGNGRANGLETFDDDSSSSGDGGNHFGRGSGGYGQHIRGRKARSRRRKSNRSHKSPESCTNAEECTSLETCIMKPTSIVTDLNSAALQLQQLRTDTMVPRFVASVTNGSSASTPRTPPAERPEILTLDQKALVSAPITTGPLGCPNEIQVPPAGAQDAIVHPIPSNDSRDPNPSTPPLHGGGGGNNRSNRKLDPSTTCGGDSDWIEGGDNLPWT